MQTPPAAILLTILLWPFAAFPAADSRPEPPAGSLNRLPLRVESNRVEARVRGLEGDDTIPNRALALFELDWVRTRIALTRAREIAALTARTFRSETEIAASRVGSGRIGSRAGQTTTDSGVEVAVVAGPRAGVEVKAGDKAGLSVEREVAARGGTTTRDTVQADVDHTDLERRTVREAAVLRKNVERLQVALTGVLESVQSAMALARRNIQARPVTTVAGEVLRARQRWRSWFRSRSEIRDFFDQHVEVMRQRNTAFAELLQQDRLLRRFYELTPAELRTEIEAETEEARELLTLEKSQSVDELVPGETFVYELLLRNVSQGSVQSVILYDEFPVGLQFENLFEVHVIRADGSEYAPATGREAAISFLTPNEWETGKIAWHVPHSVGPGESLRLRFMATWYWETGVPAEAGATIRTEPRADAPALGHAGPRDIVFVAGRFVDSDFMHVSLRRSGSRDRIDGYMLAGAFKPDVEVDALEMERRLRESVYFSGEGETQP